MDRTWELGMGFHASATVRTASPAEFPGVPGAADPVSNRSRNSTTTAGCLSEYLGAARHPDPSPLSRTVGRRLPHHETHGRCCRTNVKGDGLFPARSA